MKRLRRNLAIRLFAAQIFVVLAEAISLAVVAAAIGPAIFRSHLRQATYGVNAATSRHVEQAYRIADTLSLGVALFIALVAALTVSAYLAHRLGRIVGTLATAAARIADGQYAVRAAAPGLGAEFDTLTAAFNAMAARLEAVEATRHQLLADLGHEMRTPLSTIEGYLDAAEDGISVEGEDTLTVLRTQTGRLRRLANDITAVSRAEERRLDLHPQRIAATDLARAAVAAAQPQYTAKGVQLRERVGARPSLVYADPQRIGQALGNLLDNALRHTPPGGAVTVTVAASDGQVQLVLTISPPSKDGDSLHAARGTRGVRADSCFLARCRHRCRSYPRSTGV